MIGMGFMGMPFSIWLMKFSTDVLLIAPGLFGTLFMMGRIWDAISDPIAGFLSDRSTAARGRRRAWMFAAAVPVGVTTIMLWSPPWMLDGMGLVVWMGSALLLYETTSTCFLVPYGALGMELSDNYHERTRLFGYRHVIAAAGSMAGLGAVYLMRTADEPRTAALAVSLGGGGLMAATIFYAATRLPERADYSGRGAVDIRKAFADVLRNPHSRLLLVVYGVETFGAASIGLLAPYLVQYIVHAPNLNEVFILCYFVPQFALTPMWIRLGRRYSKKSLWLFSMICLAIGYTLLFFASEENFVFMFFVVFLLGVGGGCGAVIAPSIQADVIDYDEYVTGERKEGAYTALWNFIRKGAAGLTAGITGLALQASGYAPNAETQSEVVKITLRALVGLLPAVCYVFGAILFSRFALNEVEHMGIVKELRTRRQTGNQPR